MEKITLKNKSVLYKTNSAETTELAWVFIPGGPGMGHEYLKEFSSYLELSTPVYVLELFTPDSLDQSFDEEVIKKWKSDLVQTTLISKKIVIVGHSFGGMLCLETPELSEKAEKVIILDAAPDLKYKELYASVFKSFGTNEMNLLSLEFSKNSTRDNLRNLFVSWSPFFFNNPQSAKGLLLLANNSYCPNTYLVGMRTFLNHYKFTWKSHFNKLILISGDNDKITPVNLFHAYSQFNDSLKIMVPNAAHFPWVENPHFMKETLQKIEKSIIL